ncbi:MAG: acetoacetate decarboxylase family protein [Coriobacteriales bacterium]|jgi:2,4-dienoyl-CoA reductase-like NADH-dependent reductase (Old Yellow Enzyme family)/thioredoxin reductase
MFEKLFEAGQIGNVCTKNRLVMSPMGVNMANLDGTPSEEMIAYYEARAEGGAGIIIPEICRVDDSTGVGTPRQIAATRDSNIPGLAKLAAAVHKHGTKLFIQLHHPGRETANAMIGGQDCVSASDRMCKTTQAKTRAMTTDEVKEMIQKYIDGAVRVQKAGADGVELHAAHGYLLQQFLSPYTNNRTDEYGGSFENRMRMISEIIAGIREACGADFVLGVRLSVEEFLDQTGVTEDYIHIQDGVKIAVALEQMGIDFLDVSVGLYETGITAIEPVSYPEGWRHDLIAAVRANTKLPIIAVSNYRGPEVPEKFLEEGVIDFASFGRAWLADPEWGRKVQEGRADEQRKCVSCLRCFESLFANAARLLPLECAVNPTLGRQTTAGDLEPDTEHHKVVVVGAGPGGMCAAETAAKRGCKVTLIERDGELGGMVNYAAKPPLKEKMNAVAGYYGVVLPKLGVDIQLNTEATAESVAALEPDAVICAVGGIPVRPASIPGIDKPLVKLVRETMDGDVEIEGKNVIVVGAGMTGLETAEFIAEKGAASVKVVDMVDRPAPEAYKTNVLDVMTRLTKMGVEMVLSQKLVEVTDGGVVIEAVEGGARSELAADVVVLSMGNRPNNELKDALNETFKAQGRNVPVCTIGCAVKDGMMSPSVHQGYDVARALFTKPEPSFAIPLSDLARFGKVNQMNQQTSVCVDFVTDPAAIAEILPAPLTPYQFPVAMLSLSHIANPTFADDYYEAILGVYAMYEDKLGVYIASLLLGGPGAEMATAIGRDNAAFPKKLGAEFQIVRDGDHVTAKLARRGTQLVDVDMTLGQYNSPYMHAFHLNPVVGEKRRGGVFNFHFDMVTGPDGLPALSSGELLQVGLEYDYKSWEPGYVNKLEMKSSADDPWGCLPVHTIVGGAYNVNNLDIFGKVKLADTNAGATLLKTFPGWYDRTTMGEVGRI